MNKFTHSFLFVLLLFVILPLGTHTQGQGKKTSAGEEFFIISSVNQSQSAVLLKKPTEVTELMKTTSQTKYLDATGKAIQLTDLHSGDTVWIISSAGKDGDPIAVSIRKGPMTVEQLHRVYLDYPVIGKAN